MPVVSKAQNAAMHAAEEGHSTLGISPSVGKDFVDASHGMDVKSLPQHVGHSEPDADDRGGASDHDEDDDESREVKGRADHMLKSGLINSKAHKQIHDHVNNLKKAKRPNLAGASMPPVASAGQDHASMASPDGSDGASKRKSPSSGPGPSSV
jgi:hypothetical protein